MNVIVVMAVHAAEDNVDVQIVNVKRRKIMSNPNWNKDSNAGRNSKGGAKGNWSDRGTISIPNASPKEKEKAISIAKGTISGSAKGMGAATKGGSFKWVGSRDSKW